MLTCLSSKLFTCTFQDCMCKPHHERQSTVFVARAESQPACVDISRESPSLTVIARSLP